MANESPEAAKRPAKHICLTNRMPLGISSDPEADIIRALDDPDVLRMVRGLAEEELVAPFTDGAYGMDEKTCNATIRKMKDGGLICSRRVEYEDGIHHHYYLNEGRLKTLYDFLGKVMKDTEGIKSSFGKE
jgi:hypothetical protein